MLRIIIILGIVSSSFGQTKYQKDFDTYWKIVDQYFGYFDVQKTNWDTVRSIYQPMVDTIQNGGDFIRLLEMTNNELYNGHSSLNTNVPSSSRVIPSGTDIWVSYTNRKFMVSGIRDGFTAKRSGVKLGMQVTGFNGVSITQAIQKFLPKSVTTYTNEMYEYAANLLLAGTHDGHRMINVNDSLTFELEKVKNTNQVQLVTSKIIDKNIGYIKINNSLGNNNTITAFDNALQAIENTNGIILDLRDTPGGGNTTVARGIMGRFINKEAAYQRHSFPYEEKIYGVERKTIELVAPRGKIYDKKMVVLCGRWTGSMGEGMTIGLDGLDRAVIVGTHMADLLGAVYSYTLPETNIGFQIPAEKLFHINGSPREDFRPKHFILDTKDQLQKAVEIINASL